MTKQSRSTIPWATLSDAAWSCRANAHIYGDTKVGASLIGVNGVIYSGCNVEHEFRSRDVHAEVNAITTMVSNGCRRFDAILIVAQRSRFTPCGGCMDWIFQHGGPNCIIGFQSERLGTIKKYTAAQLMPFYPK